MATWEAWLATIRREPLPHSPSAETSWLPEQGPDPGVLNGSVFWFKYYPHQCSLPPSLHKTSHHCVCFEQRTLWSFASRCNWKIGGALEEPEKSASLGEGPLCKVPLAPSEGHHAFHCSGKGQTFAVSFNPARSIIGRGDGSS